jgi:hypothetical protein
VVARRFAGVAREGSVGWASSPAISPKWQGRTVGEYVHPTYSTVRNPCPTALRFIIEVLISLRQVDRSVLAHKLHQDS